MSLIALVSACFAILALATLFSMVGLGGGATYVPILLATGMAFHNASTTSLFMIMAASLSATLVFGHHRTVDWKLLLSIAPLAILASFIGGYIAQWVSAEVLKVIFAVVLIVAAVLMLRPAEDGQTPRFTPRWLCWDRHWGGYHYRVSMALLIPGTALAGLVAGMIGVGGGILVLPLLILLAGCPIRVSIGISSPYVGLAALSGFLGHLLAEDPFDIWLALPLATAAFVGARVGPRISLRTDTRLLRTIASIVLMALSAWLVTALLV